MLTRKLYPPLFGALLTAVVAGCGASGDPNPPSRAVNPFEDAAAWYVDSVWQSRALSEPGGSAIANESTAVWIESERQLKLGLGEEGLSLAEHLDAAVAQGAELVTIVLAHMENSDCASGHPHTGRFMLAAPNSKPYQNLIIDPLVDILTTPTYSDLRIVVVLEPHTLPQLITHPENCDRSLPGAEFDYAPQIRYALDRLSPLENVYLYLDIGNSGVLKDESHFEQALSLYQTILQGSERGFASINGLASNLENYAPLEEPLFELSTTAADGRQVSESAFYERAPYLGELDYARAFRSRLIDAGAPSSWGIVIDTSRNGWRPPAQPGDAVAAATIDELVNTLRVDRRSSRLARCNQISGIGERPKASPAADVHAYIWGYPAGWSQGVSEPDFWYPIEILDEYDISLRKFPYFCEPGIADDAGMAAFPKLGEVFNRALDNAPWRGMWFSEGFADALRNAYPPVE